jgi:hypothetical protein
LIQILPKKSRNMLMLSRRLAMVGFQLGWRTLCIWLFPTIVRLGCKMIKNGKRILTVNLQKIWLRSTPTQPGVDGPSETVLLKKILCSKEWKWRLKRRKPCFAC